MQLTPVWLLGHLSHLLPPAADQVFAGLFVANFAYFASQKLTQNIKDDIGDKSVFSYVPTDTTITATKLLSCCATRSAVAMQVNILADHSMFKATMDLMVLALNGS